MKRRTIATALAAGALLGACGGGGAAGPPPPPTGGPTPPAPPPPQSVEPPAPPPPTVEPPPAPPQTDTLLLDVAATLELGEWRHVPTRWPGQDAGRPFSGFQTVRTPNVGSADGMGWTERLVEYKGGLMLPLMRDSFGKALMLMDSTGNWTRIETPAGWAAKSERRPFNRWFRDDQYAYFSPADAKTAMGYFLRTPLEDPGIFERYGISIGDSQMDTTGNFSTCHSPEWNRFFAYTPGGKLRSWAEGEASWREHADNIPKDDRNSGYAGTVIWNPFRHEVVTIGGQSFGSNPDVSHRMLRLASPTGKATVHDMRSPDGNLFTRIRASQDRFIVSPATGEYLYLRESGVMYISADAETWTVYQDLNAIKPWGNYEQYCPWTHLSGTTDVLVMVSHIEGVWLHRLHEGGEVVVPPPPAEPAPEPPAEPPPPSADAGILARTISGMAEGEVRLALPDTSRFKVAASTGTYWMLDWTPRMHWHAPTQQLILFGHRIRHRVVAYSDDLGYWRDIPLWPGYAEGGSGHWYGWSADDGQGVIYATGNRRLDVATERWLGGMSAGVVPNGSHGTMLAWMKNVGRLARYGGDIQRWQEYDPATNVWKTYKDRVGHGQHALVEYDDASGCCLIVGGNSTVSKTSIMRPGGVLEPMPNCPGGVLMKYGSWIVAHPDGGWLVRAIMNGDTKVSRVFHIRPGDTQWRDLMPLDRLGLGYQTAAIDPARRVVLIATTTGLHALRIPSV